MQRAELQTLADGEQTLQVLQRMVALSGTGRGRVQRAQHVRAVEAVVARLLMAACADTSLSVRRTVLQSMQAASPLDAYLAQADWCAPWHLPASGGRNVCGVGAGAAGARCGIWGLLPAIVELKQL